MSITPTPSPVPVSAEVVVSTEVAIVATTDRLLVVMRREFDALKPQVAEVETIARELAALDMSGVAAIPGLVTGYRERGAAAAKAFTARRALLMDPVNVCRQEAIDFFKRMEDALKNVGAVADRKLLEWKRAEDRRREEAAAAERKRQEEAAALERKLAEEEAATARKVEEERLAREAELQRAAALESAGKTTEAAQVLEQVLAAPEPALPPPAPRPAPIAVAPAVAIPVQVLETDDGQFGFGKEPDFEVVDPWLVPREFVKPPEVRRGAVVQHLRDLAKYPTKWAEGVPGLTIVLKDKVK